MRRRRHEREKDTTVHTTLFFYGVRCKFARVARMTGKKRRTGQEQSLSWRDSLANTRGIWPTRDVDVTMTMGRVLGHFCVLFAQIGFTCFQHDESPIVFLSSHRYDERIIQRSDDALGIGLWYATRGCIHCNRKQHR